MGKLLLVFIILWLNVHIYAQQYASSNINLRATWKNPNETSNSWNGNLYSGMWAWNDTIKNKQYAIIGAASGYYFADVTNPDTIIIRDSVSGRLANSIWREIKTYDHYAYLVSDDAINNFIIVDMQYLPDSVHVISRQHAKLSHAHALWVDGNKLYTSATKLYNDTLRTSASPYRMSVFSLVNPENPLWLRNIEQDYPSSDNVHDMFVLNDTVFASSSFSGLHIYKYNQTTNQFIALGSLTSYTLSGYNHSSTLMPNKKKLIMCDEVPAGLPIKIIDVQDIANPIEDTAFYNTNYATAIISTATPHNPFVVNNNIVAISYYRDGTVLFDVSDTKNPIRVGYFDSYMQDNNGGLLCNYCGVWGSYTQLPNNILLSLDMQNGLFVLDISNVLSVKEKNIKSSIHFYPNPSSDYLNFSKSYDQILVYNNVGQLVIENYSKNQVLNIKQLKNGIYTAIIKTDNTFARVNFVKN